MPNIVGFYNVALAKTLKTFVLLGKLNYWNLGPFFIHKTVTQLSIYLFLDV